MISVDDISCTESPLTTQSPPLPQTAAPPTQTVISTPRLTQSTPVTTGPPASPSPNNPSSFFARECLDYHNFLR